MKLIGFDKIRAVLKDQHGNNSDLICEVVAATAFAGRFLWGLDRPDKNVPLWAYGWMHDKTVYVPEYGTQDVRMPWRTVADGRADCKSTAVFIGAYSWAAGYDVVLRFARYGDNAEFSHVYAVIDGLPVDPLEEYGTESKYTECLDVNLSDVVA